MTTPSHDTEKPRPAPRLRQPDRSGLCLDIPLDELLPDDDLARLLWDLSEPLDFSPWYHDIRAIEGQPGRDANDPRLFFVLWLYATLDGVRSARRLERLCYRHFAYIWLRGNVAVNYHSLASFRSKHPQRLQQLLTDTVTAMHAEGLIDFTTTAQDGLRIRASAGTSSFHRRARLEESQRQAQAYLEQLEQQEQLQEQQEISRRQRAARRRAARARLERLNEAVQQVQQLEVDRQHKLRPDQVATRGQQPVRVSTTDPDCRKMKMADGGYRPAFNAQLNTTVQGGVIATVEVVNAGTDYGQVEPMLGQMQAQYQRVSDDHLTDGGFAGLDDIEAVHQAFPQTKLYAPVKDAAKKEAAGQKPYEPKKGDTPGVAAWRQRMGSAAAQQKYRQRAATAEWANAQLRNRGLYQVTVRGLAKVKGIVLWYALAHNLTRWIVLREGARQKAS